ncbi:Predicted dienelactone hydrolase [Monaibacterium marinum]|uniref:Predicted dienelactone hydrolase n=1 Tax=Pontivivens marinum TaxID=1690039 RepID=A0A2C9CN31_9RHOB|nr:dienelactone hydrolase [Monaibacterium marinum]SOH92632.1 Predicted dienelactone hydrolase [Monaibacterium marinum]
MRILTALAVLLMPITASAQNRIDLVRPDAPQLAARGEYAIGVRTVTLTNPDVIDIVNVTADAQPRYDRPLTVEIWYPAHAQDGDTTLTTFLRDGTTQAQLQGQAVRDAEALEGEFPLVILSHGYPGNRYLMSHLGDNLASKGYVVASIDHTDSIYSDLGAFGSTLYNRPVDQHFILDTLLGQDSPIAGQVLTDRTVIVGYSMGGYGALISAGAGVTQTSVDYSWGAPQGLLARHLAGSDSHQQLMDDRLKGIVTIGAWGRNQAFWDAEGLSGIDIPTLIMAGSVDDVSDYQNGLRPIFEEMTGTDRHLLTFENANHNAAAPMPAPANSWEMSEALGFTPFEHYEDAVWNQTRMNNIAQHFVTAFVDQHLKGMQDRASYFDLTEYAADGVIALEEDGTPTAEHTYWQGFPARSAVGLRMEHRSAGN